MAEETNDQASNLLNRALETLDEWRHLPAYQLERRVDIFFGLLLPDVLEAKFELQSNHMKVIPEFPLHKGLIVNCDDEDGEDHQSVKVDFAVFYPDPDDQCADAQEKRVFLVELKSDNESIHKTQLERMKKAKDKGADTLLEGVINCARRSNSPRKYAHLIRRLDLLGCIENFEGFEKGDWNKSQPGLAGRFRCMRVGTSWSDAKIELVLVYPGHKLTAGSSRVEQVLKDSSPWLERVDFSEVAELVDGSPLSRYLVKWARCAAGTADPWRIAS